VLSAAAAGTALLLGLLLMGQMAVAAPATGGPAESLAPTTLSEGETFAVLPWGSGEGQVGRSSPEQGLDRGPEALAVAPDGRVAVLDSVNSRVVTLSADGVSSGDFSLPLSNPRYLAASNDRVAALDPDDSRRVIVATWSGKTLESAEVPATEQPATGIFLEDEQVWMEIGHSRCLLLSGGGRTHTGEETRAGRPVSADRNDAWFVATLEAGGEALVESATDDPAATAASARHEGQEVGTASSPPVRTKTDFGLPLEHLVAVEADDQGRMHIGARMAGNKDESRLVVARFAPQTLQSDGAQATPSSLLLFAEASGPYLGVPFVVAPDGRVLQPVGDADAYRILVHRLPEEN